MIKKKQFIRKAVSLSLSFAAILSPISVMAAADGPGSLTFDCGEGATTCPSRIDFQSNGGSFWRDIVGEKPIPTKPGSQFIDWELVSGNGDVVKPGDFLSQWDTYTVGDINGYGGGDVVVKAVWNSGKESTVPITISIPSTPINVTLPSSIELGFSGTDIEAVVPNNLTIQNNSSVGTMKVSEVKASLKDLSWTLSSDTSDETYKNLPLDSKQLYLGFGKDTSSLIPVTTAGFDPEITLSPRNVGESTQSFSIEAMTYYWRNKLNNSGCIWEQGSKTFNYLPSKSFYINVIYDLEEFTQAMFNSIGLTIRPNFKDLNWKAYDGDVEKGKIDWPHYIDYRPGTTIEVTDGDSFYSIAG